MKNKFIVKDSKTIVLGKVIEFDKEKMQINLSDEKLEEIINNNFNLFLFYDNELWVIFKIPAIEYPDFYWAFNLEGNRIVNSKKINDIKQQINEGPKGRIDAINATFELAIKNNDEISLIKAFKAREIL